MQSSELAPEYFKFLKAGEEFTTTINTAEVHDLKASGTYTFLAEGAMRFAIGDSTELSGEAVSFKSNALKMPVDGAAAALVPRAIGMTFDKRTVLQSGCSSAQSTSTRNALTNCAALARAAASAATSGSATKFSEYFKTTATSTRSTVSARLSAVARECASTSSGATDYYCTDVYGRIHIPILIESSLNNMLSRILRNKCSCIHHSIAKCDRQLPNLLQRPSSSHDYLPQTRPSDYDFA